MGLKTFACAAALTLFYTVTALGAETQTALQTLSSDAVEAASNEVIPMTGSKIVTDDFSFVVPERWTGKCVMLPTESGLEVYDQDDYESDGSGFMFSISAYEDDSYSSLENYAVLGFCGSETFVLNTSGGSESKSVKKGLKELQETFIAFAGSEN
ncbi:MAG: hypothetical protein KH353_06155 [Clostridium sp.]|nr:hypothetical protein [Clostridium sp.]